MNLFLFVMLVGNTFAADNLMGKAPSAHRGEPFTLKTSQPLGDILGDPSKYEGKTVRVTAKVESVCKKKGCWVILQAKDGKSARINFKGYKFFAPFDCVGTTADVEGTIKLKTLSEGERKHLAEDAGKKVDEVAKQEVRLTATALTVTR